MEKSSFNKIIIPGYFLVLCCLCYFLWITYHNLRETNEDSREFTSSLALQQATKSVFDDVRDMETGARGYVITGKDEYLKPYKAASKRIGNDLDELQNTKQYKIHAGETQVLFGLINEKINHSQNQVALRRTGGINSAINVMQTGRGKEMMDSIRVIVDKIDSDCLDRLSQSNIDKKAMAKHTVKLFFISGGLVMLFLFFSCLILYREYKKKEVYEKHTEYLSSVAYQGHDAIVYTDIQFNITNWNEGAEKIFGYTEEEVIGKPSSVIFKSTFTNENRLRFTNQILVDGYWKGEVIYHRKNFDQVYAFVTAAAFANSSGEVGGFVFLLQDKTERKAIEQKFYFMLETVSDVVMLINENAMIEAANSHAAELFGYSKDEMTGKTTEDVFPGLTVKLAKHFRQLNKSDRTKYAEQINAEGRTSAGLIFPVELSLFSFDTVKGPVLFITLKSISDSLLKEFKSLLQQRQN